MKSRLQFFLLLLFNVGFINAQNYPGGVTGAEVWYMGDWEGIENGEFANSAQTDIKITKCGEAKKNLFNFNASIISEKLCLQYMAPLENTTGRNVFFVGEPNKLEYSFSHLGTLWRADLDSFVLTDSIIRNFFDFNNKNLFARDIYTDYSSDKNANINFYHINHYNIDKKFKSYGQEGETTFYIGKLTLIDPQETYEDNHFFGNFPEFISFTKELSSNERNRVESYLALKYGLTLNEKTSYLSSKNIVFWNDTNNKLFQNRIFGFGKDGISGLNQLQSESTHLKKHLVSAIEEIVETNMEKQEQVNVPNNHFLVFGDNDGKPYLVKENNHKIKFWEKVWLAQRTGKEVNKFPIHFRLFLTEELVEYLHKYPEERLWLLQDKHIGNDEISEFDSENIEYYAGEIDWENKTAYFKGVFFDSDLSIYDQFTFGVGPQMIVQAQIKGCKEDKLEVVVDITGGKPKYHIVVESSQGGFDDYTEATTYSFLAEPGVTYNVTVYDEQGLVAEVEVTVEPWGFNLSLGPDQFLSASQPEIILDAGQGITDPDATYEWYHDGVLLSDNESILIVDEIGEYEVVVTSEDLSCSVSDSIKIDTKGFNAHISIVEACDELHNTLVISLDGGTAPFTTTLESINSTTNYAHNGSTSISDLAYGTYNITITDSTGEVFTDTIEITAPPSNLGIDIYTQLETLCNSGISCVDYSDPDVPFFYYQGSDPFSIDASIGVVNPNMTYEWYINGQPLGINDPIITFEPGYDCYSGTDGLPVFTVIATDNLTNCSVSQSFATRGICPENNTHNIVVKENNNSSFKLSTKVYPNPSEPNTTFTYEVFATEDFDGTIEIFTVTGAKLYRIEINGKSSYILPFNLQSSGIYLIRTISSVGIVKIDKVIIK